MAATRREHPLALLFWSQVFLVYALPVGLEITYRLRGGILTPGHRMHAIMVMYPFVMMAAASVTVLSDIGAIYGYVIRRTRRLPSVVVGTGYALFAFVAVSLFQSGERNAMIAWADYIDQGSTIGIIILLLALVFEMFVATFMVCQAVALARRWRRLSRAEPRLRAHDRTSFEPSPAHCRRRRLRPDRNVCRRASRPGRP